MLASCYQCDRHDTMSCCGVSYVPFEPSTRVCIVIHYLPFKRACCLEKDEIDLITVISLM
jgi:hypothetical protein